MRLLKQLLTVFFAALAIAAGLVVTLFVALTGAAVFLANCVLRARKPVPAPTPARSRPASAAAGDAIDVVATEVPADSPRP